MVNGNGLQKILRNLHWSVGSPSRSDYEAYLREHNVLHEAETLADRPDLSESIYRDWQRRSQVACVFARNIAIGPNKFDVKTVVIIANPAEEMTRAIDETAIAAVAARGKNEALTLLIPKLFNSALLIAFCKRLGARNGNWRVEAAVNPSDYLNRVHVGLRFSLSDDVEAEILGLGPFDFLPATRRAPITALEIRTKVEGSRKRGRSSTARSHLAHIPWQGSTDEWYDQAWEQSEEKRREILGGDDSAARARITFAIPRALWDGHDI